MTNRTRSSRLTTAVATTVAAFALALGSAASAQTGASTAGAASGTHGTSLAREDVAFLKQAAENGHSEVEGSRLAERLASSPKVKAFAAKMIEDHTKANGELASLAKAKGVDVPTEP